jgi:uncharacterized phiE125 gp8 family phage protein
MPWIALTQPTAEPVTLAEARSFLRESLPEDDPLITALIRAARELVEKETGLCLLNRDIAEYRDAWPQAPTLELQSWPVAEVKELRVAGADGATSLIDPAHYYLDAASRPARLVLRPGRQAPRAGQAANGIQVTLTAGFGATPDKLPESLRQAVQMQLAQMFAQRSAIAGLAPDVQRLLQPWRRLKL